MYKYIYIYTPVSSSYPMISWYSHYIIMLFFFSPSGSRQEARFHARSVDTQGLARPSQNTMGVLWEDHRILPSGKHTKNYGKSPFFMGKSTISMAIFNSYIKLPEGIEFIRILSWWYHGNVLNQKSYKSCAESIGNGDINGHKNQWDMEN